MTDARWRDVKAVFTRAMETPRAQRGALLKAACGTDAELRREVESLLAASEGEDSLPGARAAIAAAAVAYAPPDEASRGDPLASDSLEGDSTLRRLIESVLGQQYEVLEPLGRGGMGAVFLARDRALERFVAIKVLRPDLAAAPGSRERFRREARVAAQLSHPGILPLHTFGEVNGLWYFVMGYVRGESLAQRLRHEGRLPCEEARGILAELASALECAHRHGVVHRDIKPANVLLDAESGHALLADFGISKIQGGDSLTATGAVVGTPHYMSPEQALGSPDVDERSDIYSLGAVGYTMLAGHEPFAGVSSEALIYRRVGHDPAPLASVAPTVPGELAEVVTRCLARDPALRWPSARSLKEALLRAGCDVAPALPEALRDLPGFGPYALVWGVAWTSLAALAVESPGDRALLLLVALLVPLGLGLHVWNIGRQDLGRLELARIASWPPEWWGMWWPATLRRPADLWARLPRPARLARAVLSIFFGALPALILARHRLAADGGTAAAESARAWFGAAEVALILGTAAVMGGALRWGMRQGLSFGDTMRVLFGATMPSPAWRAPQVARLLAPAPGSVRPPDRDAPADYPRAIDELVPLLPAEARDAAADAARTARLLLAAITRADQEAAALARDASAADVDRLAAQLSALEEGAVGESDERRELRALVKHQLDLVHRMNARRELAARQRAQLVDLLRGLWTQLSLVHDAAACNGGAHALPVDGIRALCVEIDGQLAALPSAGPPPPSAPH